MSGANGDTNTSRATDPTSDKTRPGAGGIVPSRPLRPQQQTRVPLQVWFAGVAGPFPGNKLPERLVSDGALVPLRSLVTAACLSGSRLAGRSLPLSRAASAAVFAPAPLRRAAARPGSIPARLLPAALAAWPVRSHRS